MCTYHFFKSPYHRGLVINLSNYLPESNNFFYCLLTTLFQTRFNFLTNIKFFCILHYVPLSFPKFIKLLDEAPITCAKASGTL